MEMPRCHHCKALIVYACSRTREEQPVSPCSRRRLRMLWNLERHRSSASPLSCRPLAAGVYTLPSMLTRYCALHFSLSIALAAARSDAAAIAAIVGRVVRGRYAF